MSEAERNKRSHYKQNRKKWILIQASAILLVALIALSMFIVYSSLNKTYYVSYAEEGYADYNVVLKENEFFANNTIPDGQGYITELIDKINTTFRYQMHINSPGVKYEYTSYVEATLKVVDKTTEKVLYSPTFDLVEKQTKKTDGYMNISDIVSIDYHKYNNMAAQFIDVYGLENADCSLVVTMYADISGSSNEFIGTAENDYSVSVVIPLCKKTISISTTSSAPNSELNLLPCRRDTDPAVFSALAIVFTCVAALLGGALIGFVYITRNDDINYEIKVKKLLNSYRSYIQIITNSFDTTGYQILVLSTFNEMLGIRDTIQSPILMSENEDKTRTLFLIPTNTKILYVFEIRSDDYDRIYAEKENKEVEEPVVEEPVVEEPVVEEPVVEEPVAEESSEPEEAPEPEIIEETPAPNTEELTDGVEVIDVSWREHENKNKVYKYDPNGESLEQGDIVLVPSRDVHQNKDIIRQAAVVKGNYMADPSTITTPLKKIIGVVRRGICSQLEK